MNLCWCYSQSGPNDVNTIITSVKDSVFSNCSYLDLIDGIDERQERLNFVKKTYASDKATKDGYDTFA